MLGIPDGLRRGRRPCSIGPDGTSRPSPGGTGDANADEVGGIRVTGPAAGLLHQIAPQLARTAWGAQLPQRLRLDLADALAAHVELCAALLERPGAAVLQPEPELEHSALTSRQRVEHGRHLLLEQLVRHGLGRGQRAAVLDEVAERPVLLLADRRVEGDRLLAELGDLAD